MNTIPHNLEAEKSIIGSLLLYPDRIDLIREKVYDDDFYDESYGIIYKAIRDMSDALKPIDELTLANELKNRNQLNIIGGGITLAELTSSIPNSSNVEYYADIVHDNSIMRKLISISNENIENAYNSQNAAETINDAEQKIYGLAEKGVSINIPEFKEVLKSTMHQIEDMSKRDIKDGTTGIATDFHQLDYMTSGLHGGELIIIAGRPSMGKSTFALNILAKVAIEQKKPSLIFSLEMTKENIAKNILCSVCDVRGQDIRSGRLSAKDWGNLGQGLTKMAKSPLFIDDSPGLTLSLIRSKARRIKRSKGLSLIVIDYLQLMTGNRRKESNRQQEISEISRGLKELARELEVPVIALSQLNRGVEGRADHRPMLSDLRESGAIEQDADLVMLLHRPSYYSEDNDNKAHVIIAKQRNGPTGTVKLVFVNDKLRFENDYPRGD